MKRRWPNAVYVEDRDGTAGLAQRIFDTKCGGRTSRCAWS